MAKQVNPFKMRILLFLERVSLNMPPHFFVVVVFVFIDLIGVYGLKLECAESFLEPPNVSYMAEFVMDQNGLPKCECHICVPRTIYFKMP